MPVRVKQSGDESLYYLTFTCFNLLPLFQVANAYDAVYKWFEYLKNKKNIKVTAYVIMPNHLHCILFFADNKFLSKQGLHCMALCVG